MTLDEIRKYTNTIADKHRSGNTLSEEEFNVFLEVCNMEMFNAEFEKVVANAAAKDIPLNHSLLTSTELRHFKVYDQDILMTSGVGDLPTNYKHYLGVKTALSKRDVDILDDHSFSTIQSNMFFVDFNQKPMAVIYGGKIKIIPSNVDTLTMAYLRKPTVPYYDWCVKTSTMEVVYMPYWSAISGGHLMNLNNMTIIESNVVHPTGGTLSQTVELEWDEFIHPHFANRILLKMGIPLNDPQMYQLVKTEDQ